MAILLKEFVEKYLLEKENKSMQDFGQQTIQVPKILYHGTTTKFDQFDPNKIGKRDSGNLGTGVYLAFDDRTAMAYAEDNVKRFGGKPIVLRVEHTLDSVANFPKFIPALKKQLNIKFPPKEKDKERSDKIRDWFLMHGYDAAASPDAEIAVFDLSKLKILGLADTLSTSDHLKKVYRDYLKSKDKEAITEARQKIYFHGSKENLESFDSTARPWTAFDRKEVSRPIWLSPSKKFAKLYAGHHGWVYTVRPSVKKTFPDQDIYKENGKYFFELTDFGEKLLEDIVNKNMFDVEDDDWYEAEEILKSINNLDYGTLETKDFIDWLKAHGYDSFYVSGDGPVNLSVLNPEKVKIIKKEKASNLNEFINSLLR